MFSRSRSLSSILCNTSSMAALGIMKFDRDDLINLANAGRLNDVITHEMLHIVGIGLLFGSVAIVDLRLIGLGRRVPVCAVGQHASTGLGPTNQG